MFWPASTVTVKQSMQRDPRAFLWGVREAALAVQPVQSLLDELGDGLSE